MIETVSISELKQQVESASFATSNFKLVSEEISQFARDHSLGQEQLIDLAERVASALNETCEQSNVAFDESDFLHEVTAVSY